MSKILLIDDDIDLAELVKTKLSAEGHEAYTINTGDGAFELAKQIKPDIAILDIMLPGVTGYQICRRLRKDPELYKMAILILTALGEEPEILHGLEQGADDYLVKPFKLERLTEKLAALNALLQAANTRNPFTNLPGTDAVKREINHRLARGAAIAACYIDAVGFKPYCAARGPAGQQEALAFIAKLLTSLTRDMGIYECFVSHMGGEHFVVLLNQEDYERFCSALLDTFDRSVQQLYTAQEISQGYLMATDKRGREVRCPLMALSVGVAHTQFRQFKSAKKMFEVLAQTRQMAQPDGKSILFVDRRRTDR
ncbi:MAG: response regulator [Nitrospiraceae bacterium]|nr:response regulator [Nitrospiraceae bacterium]